MTKVFWYAVIICIAIVLWGAFFPDHLNTLTESVTDFISDQFGWFYIFVLAAMIVCSLFLMFSQFGKIKLGKERSEEHTSELQSRAHLVCRLLLEKQTTTKTNRTHLMATSG